jgi:hypothetical protein
MNGRGKRHALVAAIVVGWAANAAAEPKFLSKQYTRCTTCHISPTGGALLSAYGRSLSHRELSTTGAPMSSHGGEEDQPAPGEESFLWGALGDRLGNLELGVELRPSYLRYAFLGISSDRNLLMNADVLAAYKVNDWVLYGQVGRELDDGEFTVDSSEYWAGYQPEEGLGFRAGRFLPAYGVRFADHTSYNRSFMGLAQYDQVFGVEVSHTRGRYLTQVALGPGRAESLIDDDGRASFTATGRVQVDLTSRASLAGSALFRAEADNAPRMGSAGVALGVAPGPRLSTWTQVDGQFVDGASSASYVIVNETALEVYRGLWLTISPQARVGGGAAVPDLLRFAIGAVALPRTHFNVNVSYYRDRNRTSDITTSIFLAQLHLYL